MAHQSCCLHAPYTPIPFHCPYKIRLNIHVKEFEKSYPKIWEESGTGDFVSWKKQNK